MDQDELHARFAAYVATLGRGPGRSRALTREEARDAFAMVLRREPDPMQVGAFLMLLRYRGEDLEEITGLVEAARGVAGLGRQGSGQGSGQGSRLRGWLPVDLDWPSYGAGRTRAAPWFLLSALALADSGVRVLMHGSNEFSGGISVAAALAALGLPVQTDDDAVGLALAECCFAYWPAAAMAPSVEGLLGLRRLFGLRSPVNTVARLLDPADAAASVDGVFHPPYIALHLGVAERLRRPSLLVLKGGGGEAERAPGKAVTVHLQQAGAPSREITLPALGSPAPRRHESDDAATIRAIWHGEKQDEAVLATITGSIAIALLALGRCETADIADRLGKEIWSARRTGSRAP